MPIIDRRPHRFRLSFQSLLAIRAALGGWSKLAVSFVVEL